MTLIRRNLRKGVAVLACALSFLAGGVFVPQLVSATVSSGERAAFFPLPPTRILDTRVGPTPLPVGTKLGQGQTIDLQVGGVGGVPATAAGAVLNVTATNGTAGSLLIVYPAGQARPTASSLNFGPGQTIPNAVTVKLPAGSGKVSIYNNVGAVDVVVDVNGYYENANFDDRYYVKAQTDAQISAAITTPDHITGAQVANNSLTGSDIGDGSLTLGDLTGSGPFLTYPLGALSVPAKGCAVVGVSLSSGDAYRMLVPMRVGVGISGAASLGTSPVVLNTSGSTALNVCNRSTTVFTGTNVQLDYYLT